jgi:hypothetical protein
VYLIGAVHPKLLTGATTLRTLRHELYGQERCRRLVQYVLEQPFEEGRGRALPLLSAHGTPKCRSGPVPLYRCSTRKISEIVQTREVAIRLLTGSSYP